MIIGFQTWPDFVVAHCGGEELTGWIFRGHADWDYKLLPLLSRTLAAAGHLKADWPSLEQEAFGFFKQRARAVRSDCPEESDILGWLALMQHYRAPTRLLDWSFSPFVAAFFAYSTASTGADCAIWEINAEYFRSFFGTPEPGTIDHLGVIPLITHSKDGTKTVQYPGRDRNRRRDETELLRWVIEERRFWPLPVIPFDRDPRMLAQQAVFTCSGDLEVPLDVLCDVSGEADGAGEDESTSKEPSEWLRATLDQMMVKVRLPFAWRQEALMSLRRMGITAESLFPGLDGIGAATSMHLQLGGRSIWSGLTP
jgi:hypothetical protein